MLTAVVLRTTNASVRLIAAAFEWQGKFTARGATDATWASDRTWHGNPAFIDIPFAVKRAMLAACEQGRGLAEPVRFSHGYTVALAEYRVTNAMVGVVTNSELPLRERERS